MATTALIQEVHMFDTGLAYIVTVMDDVGVVDLSDASLIEFHFQKPDGSTLIVVAEKLTDGSDGQLVYSSQPTDFDQSGTWRQQVYIVIGPDIKWSNIVKFKVFPNIPLEI